MPASKKPILTRLTAAAITQREDGRYLFVEERSQGRLVFNQPSGGWEPGETMMQTAIREAAEEASVVFRPTSFLGMLVTSHTKKTGVSVCTIRAAYAGDVLSGFPGVPRDETILRTVWMTYKEAMLHRDRHRSSAVMRCLDLYQSGRRFPIDSLNEVNDDTWRHNA